MGVSPVGGLRPLGRTVVTRPPKGCRLPENYFWPHCRPVYSDTVSFRQRALLLHLRAPILVLQSLGGAQGVYFGHGANLLFLVTHRVILGMVGSNHCGIL